MATASEIATILAAELGVPKSLAETIARRLGEAGVLPRGSRGHPPMDLNIGHTAYILLGILNAGDGIAGSATRVVQAVEAIGAQHCDATVCFSQADSPAGREYLPKLVEKGSFHEALTHLIGSARDPEFAIDCKKILSAIGVSFLGDSVCAWLELKSGWEGIFWDGPLRTTSAISGAERIIFGESEPDDWHGMIREVRVDTKTLVRLAAKLEFEDRVSSKEHGKRPHLEDE